MLIAGIALGLVTVVAIAGNTIAASTAEQRIADAIACRLPPPASVAGVEFAWSPTTILSGGAVGNVIVEVEQFTFRAAALDVTANLALLSLDPDDAAGERAEDVRLVVDADAEALKRLAPDPPAPQDAGGAADLRIDDGSMSVTASAGGLPVAVVLVPAAADGDVSLTPETVRIGTRTFEPDVLRSLLEGSPYAGAAIADLLRPRALDVGALPDHVSLTSVDVIDDFLRLRLAIGDDADFASPETSCADRP